MAFYMTDSQWEEIVKYKPDYAGDKMIKMEHRNFWNSVE